MTYQKVARPDVIASVWFDFSWNNQKVWVLNEPTVSMPIDVLLWHFDYPFLDRKGTDDYNLTGWELLLNPYREDEHYGRILAANTAYPIDVMPNNGRLTILDGFHRLCKLYLMWQKMVPVRVIPRSRIWEITNE